MGRVKTRRRPTILCRPNRRNNVIKMPRSFYEAEEDQDKTPCGKLREDLKYCLQQTDCFKLEGKTMKECLMTQHPSVPRECTSSGRPFSHANDHCSTPGRGSAVGENTERLFLGG